jgi:hypothetical protein
MTIEIWLTLALVTSLTINIVLAWFSREQSKRLSHISENIFDLIHMIKTFRGHLKNVYSLEAFYGDETLEALMLHTKSLMDILDDEYSDVIDIFEPPEILSEEIEENEEKEFIQSEENVFYAGTRNSNS